MVDNVTLEECFGRVMYVVGALDRHVPRAMVQVYVLASAWQRPGYSSIHQLPLVAARLRGS